MAGQSGKQRLDIFLVDQGYFPTRARARDAILRGAVAIDGSVAVKASAKVAADADITINDQAAGYVSRAALKLKAGLEASGYEVAGRRALDIGASTGGFTQVLLEAGVSHVAAIDVGHGQMDRHLAADARVTAIEGLNARHLRTGDLPYVPDLIVCDVSFISITLALPPALDLAAMGALAFILVKPQFEVGAARIGKNGIVSAADSDEAAARLKAWFAGQEGWRVEGMVPSPIKGGDGNTEHLLWGCKV